MELGLYKCTCTKMYTGTFVCPKVYYIQNVYYIVDKI